MRDYLKYFVFKSLYFSTNLPFPPFWCPKMFESLFFFVDEISLIDNQYNEDSYPGSWSDKDFDWNNYLAQYQEKPASERLFKHVNFLDSSPEGLFTIREIHYH